MKCMDPNENVYDAEDLRDDGQSWDEEERERD
ncbi:Uncharacterised protein [Mycobacteroides abscessus subsp. abscessus]|nr:hypothetical protein [Mycobacteroides abscessus]SID61781.1 Uncharacterised protein [Mycobacteroides abscessus subsp. abscessus]SLC90809.1 Uncharacterised protein [Mycobacteroides abscessus subsp. massiliense]SIE83902.1 Uncharacterised protein [Mycobacteroides abscessus subsp. abscessus]SIF72099.1 Uncharacterised protein [Mycobacteroides abscessus subsp. abscessus]